MIDHVYLYIEFAKLILRYPFESINRQLNEMGYEKVSTFNSLKEEYDLLAARKVTLDATYQAEKK